MSRNSVAALLSIHPKYADLILQGKKTVELRRGAPRITSGQVVIVYVTAPRMEIAGSFVVGNVVHGSPNALWRKYGKASYLSAAEFHKYFDGAEVGTAILVDRISRLERPITLSCIRSRLGAFQPPQRHMFLSYALVKRLRVETIVTNASPEAGLFTPT